MKSRFIDIAETQFLKFLFREKYIYNVSVDIALRPPIEYVMFTKNKSQEISLLLPTGFPLLLPHYTLE